MPDGLLGSLRDRSLSAIPGGEKTPTSGGVTAPSARRTEPGSVGLGKLAREMLERTVGTLKGAALDRQARGLR